MMRSINPSYFQAYSNEIENLFNDQGFQRVPKVASDCGLYSFKPKTSLRLPNSHKVYWHLISEFFLRKLGFIEVCSLYLSSVESSSLKICNCFGSIIDGCKL